MLWATLMATLAVRTLWGTNKTLLVGVLHHANYTLHGTQQFADRTGIPFNAVTVLASLLGLLSATCTFIVTLLIAQGYCIARAAFADAKQSRLFVGLTCVATLLQAVVSAYGQLYPIAVAFLHVVVIRLLGVTIADLKAFHASLDRFISVTHAGAVISTMPTRRKLAMLRRALSVLQLEVVDVLFHAVLVELLWLRTPLTSAGVYGAHRNADPVQDGKKGKAPTCYIVLPPQHLH
ncbi:hypothetical protein SeLEV6574_g05964, partial [Synchytrium endobioticum]